MKSWISKVRWKAVLAVVLIAALCVGNLLLSSPKVSQAAEVPDMPDMTEVSLFNGDFESGRTGYNVRGWNLTSMKANTTIETKDDWTKNYTLKTVSESGNRTAAISKVSGGYAAMTSAPFVVAAGTGYRIRYDYKTTEITNAASVSDFYGIHAAVQELNADGEQVSWTVLNDTGKGKGQTVSENWMTVTHDFIAAAGAESAVLYLAIGGVWNVKATVLFDNVAVYQYDSRDVMNGDFEAVFHGQDGGREGEKEGPACWTTLSCNIGGKPGSDGFHKNYIAEIVEETGESGNINHVLKQYPKAKTRGYSMVQSSYVPVSAGEAYCLSWKSKITVDGGGTLPPANIDGAYAVLSFYDADKNLLSQQSSKNSKLAVQDWTKESYSNTVPNGAVYVRIGFYIGGIWDGASGFAYYYDDVSLFVDDGSNGAMIYNGDGEASDSAIPGFQMVSTKNGPDLDPSANWAGNYTISCVPGQGVDGTNAILVTKKLSYGYAAMASSKLQLIKGQKYTLQYAYKITELGGTSEVKHYPISAYVITYDQAGSQVETLRIDMHYGQDATEVPEWTDSKVFAFTPTKDSAYAVLYLGTGTVGGQGSYKIYFDNITLREAAELGWTSEKSDYEGIATPDAANDFRSNYGITTIDVDGRNDVVKLYVTRPSGILGAATYFSEAIPIKEKITYTTSYDLRITGRDTEGENLTGAVYVVRYLDSNGQIVRYDKINTPGTCPKLTQDWTYYSKDITAPAGAVLAQIGLLIGGTKMNETPDIAYYYDNVKLEEKDPAVSASPLYNKSILFLGDESSKKLADEAERLSIMNATVLSAEGAGFAESLAERVLAQIDTVGSNEYDYIYIGAGAKDAAAGVPLGTVTEAYDGNYDAETFAGALEEVFMNLAQSFDGKKIAYVFPCRDAGNADLSAYYAVAKAAAEKWHIPFLDNLYTTSLPGDAKDEDYWNELIAPLEELSVFDSTDIPGFASEQVWEARLSKIVGAGITPATNVTALGNLLAKVKKDGTLPELATRIEGYLEEYEAYRAKMQGATIAEGDANKLRFLAESPGKAIPENIKLLEMGILIMSAEAVAAGTPLEIGTSSAAGIRSSYTAAGAGYDAVLSGESCDPNVVYAAVAYAVYRVDGKEYVLYSDNDYANTYGMVTAQNGKAEASVYGIAKEIASRIVATQSNKINWSYIGGSVNKELIESAQEEGTKVSCYDVLRFVSHNHILLDQ